MVKRRKKFFLVSLKKPKGTARFVVQTTSSRPVRDFKAQARKTKAKLMSTKRITQKKALSIAIPLTKKGRTPRGTLMTRALLIRKRRR